MSAKKALAMILLWGLAFAVLGAMVGALLGGIAPDYYRSLLRRDLARAGEFNPVQMGIGLGATQGLAAGVALSLGVLALLAWQDARRGHALYVTAGQGGVRTRRHWSSHLLWGIAMTLAVMASGSVAFLVGGITGQSQLYQTWTDEKLRRLDAILDNGEFPLVNTGYSSAAQVYLQGSVRSQAERTQLRELLVQGFGTKEGEAMIRLVEVAP